MFAVMLLLLLHAMPLLLHLPYLAGKPYSSNINFTEPQITFSGNVSSSGLYTFGVLHTPKKKKKKRFLILSLKYKQNVKKYVKKYSELITLALAHS